MRALPLVVTLLLAAGCAGEAGELPATQPRVTGLRTSAEVADTLQRAERAYVAGDWGAAIVAASAVLEGAARPDEFYAALKILGHSSCNRRDARPAIHALPRLQPDDREALKRHCARQGVALGE